MPRQQMQLFAGCGIPDSHRAILACACHLPAIRAEGHRCHTLGVPGQRAQWFACGDIPERDRQIQAAAAAGEDFPSGLKASAYANKVGCP